MFRFTIAFLFLLIAPIVSIGQGLDTLNQKDDTGRKQGYWIIYGKDKPERGYPPEGKIEEGTYKDGRKTGIWIKYWKDGKTPRLKGTYINNRPNGWYEKYDERGVLSERGDFQRTRGKKHYFKEYYPSGCVKAIHTDTLVMFFKDDCSNSDPLGTVDHYERIESRVEQDYHRHMKQEIIYRDSSFHHFPIEHQSLQQTPNPADCKRLDGKSFHPNSYNKLYNSDSELVYDGEFKGGRLWNGKKYIYDTDGILLKIEIWKNGKYYADGAL